MNFLEIQKNNFNKYEKVRKSGKYNMITEAHLAAIEAGLSREDYMFTMKNYTQLKNQ